MGRFPSALSGFNGGTYTKSQLSLVAQRKTKVTTEFRCSKREVGTSPKLKIITMHSYNDFSTNISYHYRKPSSRLQHTTLIHKVTEIDTVSLRHRRVQTGFGAHSIPWVSRIKRPGRESDHLSPSSAEVKNASCRASTFPDVFTAWCLIKHRNNLYLSLTFY
jgi:hypothetical protein